jgi:hypothetical protein
MKASHVFLFFCVICVLTTGIVSAQNGAVVVREENLWAWWETDGEGLLAIMSSDSDFFCNDDLGDVMIVDQSWVFRPDGSIKYKDKGHFFTRVYYPVDMEDFRADPCAYWFSDELLVASGISHTVYSDNDANVRHPNRRNVWGYTISGMLADHAGMCSDGMVELNRIWKVKLDKKQDYPDCWPGCRIVQVDKGPRLICD